MMKNSFLRIAAAAGALLVAPHAVSAQTVTYTFTGEVVEPLWDGPGWLDGTNIGLGTRCQGTFTYAPSAQADEVSVQGADQRADYYDSGIQLTATIGDASFGTEGLSANIRNGASHDVFEMIAASLEDQITEWPLPVYYDEYYVVLRFGDPSAEVFDSTSLPDSLDLEDFGYGGLFLYAGELINPANVLLTGCQLDHLERVYDSVATVVLSPRMLNSRSRGNGGYVTAHIELAEGLNPALIDVSTVALAVGDTSIDAELEPTALGDFDEDGIPDLMVKFSRPAVLESADGKDFEGVLSGSLEDGSDFAGSAFVEVK